MKNAFFQEFLLERHLLRVCYWLVLSKSEILIMIAMVCWPVSSNEWKAPQVPLNGIQYPDYGISQHGIRNLRLSWMAGRGKLLSVLIKTNIYLGIRIIGR